MATIKDVARQAGVSISTVSRVINQSAPVIEAKYHAVNKAMLMLDYRPNAHAQALVRKYSNTFGLMMGNTTTSLCVRTLMAVEKIVSQESKRLVLSCGKNESQSDEYASLEKLLLSSCDTFVIQAHQLSDMQLVKLLRYHPSAVLLGRRISVLAEQCVYADYFRAGYRSTQYLSDLGHKVIGFINKKGDLAASKLLKEGYHQALKESGITPSSLWVHESGDDTEGGYIATRTLLDRVPNMTALISFNDVMAAGALKALQKAGKRVPQDISLIGCEDTGIADYLSPGLTTMRSPLEKMAEHAARLALSRVEKRGYTSAVSPDIKHFIPTLVVRDSVMPVIKITKQFKEKGLT